LALVLSGAAATANAQTNGEFTATPRSGPAATKIHIRSVTPCFAPPGVARSEVADVAVGSAEFDVAGDGSWDGTLVVSTKAVAGAATLTAFCKASPQAEGAILAYTEQPFTVTSGTLARTGSSPLPILLAGLALLGGGALLLRIRPRRT
jgi:LPXTG-motif cell wall-anchored protein